MPRYTFKMQFQDTFAWMICLNSLFFLGERQPTVMKYVWEINMKIKLLLVSLCEFSRPRFGGRDLGWKSWFCTYWLKTLFDLRRELLTSNVREESFWRWIEEEFA